MKKVLVILMALIMACFSISAFAVDYVDETSGYNGCGKGGPGKWLTEGFEWAIDHILVRDMPEGAVRTFDRYSPDFYLYLSDHSPIIADIEI